MGPAIDPERIFRLDDVSDMAYVKRVAAKYGSVEADEKVCYPIKICRDAQHFDWLPSWAKRMIDDHAATLALAEESYRFFLSVTRKIIAEEQREAVKQLFVPAFVDAYRSQIQQRIAAVMPPVKEDKKRDDHTSMP
jgi:hypothetical protein